jgi:hypothetical protein
MKEMFTFQNFPMAIIVALVVVAWFVLLTVLFAS